MGSNPLSLVYSTVIYLAKIDKGDRPVKDKKLIEGWDLCNRQRYTCWWSIYFITVYTTYIYVDNQYGEE